MFQWNMVDFAGYNNYGHIRVDKITDSLAYQVSISNLGPKWTPNVNHFDQYYSMTNRLLCTLE